MLFSQLLKKYPVPLDTSPDTLVHTMLIAKRRIDLLDILVANGNPVIWNGIRSCSIRQVVLPHAATKQNAIRCKHAGICSMHEAV